jgi:hypothetical protein
MLWIPHYMKTAQQVSERTVDEEVLKGLLDQTTVANLVLAKPRIVTKTGSSDLAER